jgi:hypothetical protein
LEANWSVPGTAVVAAASSTGKDNLLGLIELLLRVLLVSSLRVAVLLVSVVLSAES